MEVFSISSRLKSRLLSLLKASEPKLDVPCKPNFDNLEGRKLNIGCGWDYREDWVNIDIHERHKPDIVADCTRLHFSEDHSAVYVLAQDILEHIQRDR